MKEPILKVDVEGGKYTVIQEQGGTLKALRHGEEWRDLCGDNMVYCLAVELEEARKRLNEIHNWAVCGAIATPEDMMQNLPRIVELSDPTKPIE